MNSPPLADTAAFKPLPHMLREHARRSPQQPALGDDGSTLTYAQLDALMDRIACALQRDGIKPGQSIAICALNSVRYAALFLGALRAGVVVAPMAPSSSPESLASMLRDAQARCLFLDASAPKLATYSDAALPCISMDGIAGGRSFDGWLAPEGAQPMPVDIAPGDAFNIIYSSGTTGVPKGIVQSHGMRWTHVKRGSTYDYSAHTITLLATPLYSNTTLVVFFPTMAWGGRVQLMPKFDALRYVQLAEQHRATHTMLVPVQYQRIMALPEFGEFDLSSFRFKFCTSAPFRAALKADVLARWPGHLTEFYGMTEGGGTCILEAHLHPDKLHTVGQPAQDHDIRLIDESGQEVGTGEAGEVVGHSAGMMTGYHGQPAKTRETEWFDPQGKRFIRTGDVGRFDDQGFLTLIDRRKDMIISGGFNIYPSDLEEQLMMHPSVREAAVVGVPSEQWGETPVAFVVPQSARVGRDELLGWFNQRAGKIQRLADLQFVKELPRSAIGKVLKRELREGYR